MVFRSSTGSWSFLGYHTQWTFSKLALVVAFLLVATDEKSPGPLVETDRYLYTLHQTPTFKAYQSESGR
jgi:hypothetical protein